MIAPASLSSRVALVEDDLSRFSCQNAACPDHGKAGQGNLTVDSLYGRQKTLRMLLCRTCKRASRSARERLFSAPNFPRVKSLS